MVLESLAWQDGRGGPDVLSGRAVALSISDECAALSTLATVRGREIGGGWAGGARARRWGGPRGEGGGRGGRGGRAYPAVRYSATQVMSASVKPRLAGRQPSFRGGVPRVKTRSRHDRIP
ncbi:hypothetical protein GCM10009800_27230 [Nocardiopsis rhodophaea]